MTTLQFIADIKWFVLVVVLLILGARKWRGTPEATRRAIKDSAARRGWKLGLGGNTLEVTAENAQVLAGATATDAELAAQLPHPAADTPAPEAAEEEAALVQQQRRAYIEEIMRASAEWGWKMAHAGHKAPPTPYVDWSTGEPRIMFGVSTYPIQYGPPLTFEAPPIVFAQPGRVPDESED